MTTIYDTYDDEPQDVFIPIDSHTYALFYQQEMKEFDADLSFYTTSLPPTATILELGCGGARLSRLLLDQGYKLTGIDLSNEMLEIARQVAPTGDFLSANICNFDLNKKFDAIIAPYNVLNLLPTAEDIGNCLAQCYNHLTVGGRLIFEVHSHNTTILAGEKSFQFQVFPHPEGGRLVKEIVKIYGEAHIEVEERYRSRPTDKNFIDYSHRFSINSFSKSFWNTILTQYGFEIISCTNHYPSEPQDTPHSGKTLFTAKVRK